MDRRSSDNDAPSRPPSTANVFDDDHEVDLDEEDFMPSVSDGFRPANASQAWSSDRQDHDRNEPVQRTTSTSKPPPERDLRRTATRNSTAKVRDAIPPDGRPAALHNRGPSSPSPLGHRASVSSTGSFATTSNGDNPFETGPSHPYGMYPQHTMARTASVATSSSSQHPSRPMSLHRPTHPYAMYSQSGLDEGLDDALPAEPAHPQLPPIQTTIPLGFPGHGTGYHRVLGPDGEELDIIGPDGHTEQLPAYSQYPDEGPTKASLAAQASASRIIPAPGPVADPDDPFNTPVSPVSSLNSPSFPAPAAPAMPLLPSVTPARLPPQRPETQTGNVAPATSVYSSANQIPAEPTESSSASLLTTEQGHSEKPDPEETTIPWHKKKLWGRFPMGVVVGATIMLLCLAIAVGVGIGAVISKKHHNKIKTEHDKPKEEPYVALLARTPVTVANHHQTTTSDRLTWLALRRHSYSNPIRPELASHRSVLSPSRHTPREQSRMSDTSEPVLRMVVQTHLRPPRRHHKQYTE
jgi:hypothetical protein